jgi:hypothetical protein
MPTIKGKIRKQGVGAVYFVRRVSARRAYDINSRQNEIPGPGIISC